MRKGSLKEVLAKIKHDPREDESNYYIVIEHRGAYGNEKRIPVEMIELGRGYFFIGGTQIPYHRIIRGVRGDGKVIWERRGEGND